MINALRIVELRDEDALISLSAEWRALQAQCDGLTPFQTWEWNEAWWRYFGARKRLCLLCFYSGATLVGIAPLYTSWHLGTPLRRLAWLGTGPSDYLGLLARPDQCEAVAAALLHRLSDRLRGWDIADLQQLRGDNALMASAPRPWPDRSADMQAILAMEPCPYLALPATWDAFMAGLGKKMRSNLSYHERLLQRTFPESSCTLADSATLDAAMTALFELHQRRWNARWLPGVLGNRRVQGFHREVARRFLDRDWLRLHLLTVDGVVRSALYCYSLGGCTYYYLGGFAPELGKYSLGTLLTARAIRCAVEEGCREFDFLRGDETYKMRWSPRERRNYRILLLRPRDGLGGLGELPGRAGFALNRMERYVEMRAKAFASRPPRQRMHPVETARTLGPKE